MTMYIALDENKKLVDIKDVERGLACQCTCFECGETVIARKGEIKEHHFAHASNKESCTINPESVLHKYAKEVILEYMGLMLPALPNSDNEAAWWTFDKLLPEFSLGLIRPDLVGYFDGEPILIEIAVTHFIDAEKLKYIEFFKLKCIEIDLSSLLTSNISIPSTEAKKEILENLNNRKWVYPFLLSQIIENNPNDVPTENISVSLEKYENIQTSPKWQDYKFTIKGIFVNVRKFNSGMISVNSTYNPEIIAMLKEWKREGRGSFNPTYKSWNYWLPFSEVVLDRLKELNE
ncbi:competence protein CoiA family protein [Acinetobacter radioresistens]|uniref:competence protein CoiA family protein n=1 Tax=Acinetobacter radioresistens TaxID=40216 RepID=UPI0009465F81|nr:competence protein CoiA family protein [Acinetobacter radioresistens]